MRGTLKSPPSIEKVKRIRKKVSFNGGNHGNMREKY